VKDLSLHILDIVENSIQAGAKRVKIRITEELKQDLFLIEIEDDGQGIKEEVLQQVFDPFFTTKNKKVGLGLPLFAQAAKEAEGRLVVDSKINKGTKITAIFKYSHLDRKPLGDMAETMIVLIAGHPEVDFLYEHKKGRWKYSLDTAKIKVGLEGVPINYPEVIKIIQNDIKEG